MNHLEAIEIKNSKLSGMVTVSEHPLDCVQSFKV